MMASPDDLARDCIKAIQPYSPGRTAPIKLASNENPVGPSPRALAAMEAAVRETRLYPDLPSTALTKAIASHFGLQPENVVVGSGSDEIIYLLAMAYLDPGEEVILSTPPFATYALVAPLMNARLVAVPARDFRHDLEAMAAAVTDRTKLIFISNPYNPTGTIVTRQEVDRLLGFVADRAIVVLDEAYCEYVESHDYPDSLRYIREGRNVLALRTFSKVHALAGLRVGYGMGPAALVRWLVRVREPFNVNSIAQAAALASLEDREQVERSVALNRQGKQYLYRQFGEMGLSYVPTEANFIFVDLGMDSRVAFDGLWQRGIAVRTGDIFGLTTYARVTIGTPEQNEQFVRALQEVRAEGEP
jgi:histidinol-phosphate aminotransferase